MKKKQREVCGEFIDMTLYHCKHCGKEYFEENSEH